MYSYIGQNTYKKNLHVFLLSLILSILNVNFFHGLNAKYFHYSFYDEGIEELSKVVQFFVVVILMPLIETILLNVVPNIALKKLKVKSKSLFIIVPSIFFSIWHYYNPIYIPMAFLEGIVLNGYYVYSQKNTRHTFMLLCLIHTCYSLYYFILMR